MSKVLRFVRRPAVTLLAAVAMGVSQADLRAEDDIRAELAAFRKKVAEKEAERSPQMRGEGQFSAQLQQLELLLAQGRYDRVQAQLGTNAAYGLPVEYRDAWISLVDRLGKEAERKQNEVLVKWRADVDQLAEDARKACLAAKTSADLDTIAVRCAALQMGRDQRSDMLQDRYQRKLMGTVATVTAWTNYLDYHANERTKQANDVLRNMIDNGPTYPLLTTTEIRARSVIDPGHPDTVRATTLEAIKGLKTPADLPAVLAKVKSLYSPGNVPNDNYILTTLLQAAEATQAGDVHGTAVALESYTNSSGGGLPEAKADYARIANQLLSELLVIKAREWSVAPPKPQEDARAFAVRSLAELTAAGNYSLLLEAVKFSAYMQRTLQPPAMTHKDRQALELFLAAQRFEQLGDLAAAVAYYRQVVAIDPGLYSPLAPAQEAMKRLQKQVPDAFKTDESLMLQELRVLREQLSSQRFYGSGPQRTLPAKPNQ